MYIPRRACEANTQKFHQFYIRHWPEPALIGARFQKARILRVFCHRHIHAKPSRNGVCSADPKVDQSYSEPNRGTFRRFWAAQSSGRGNWNNEIVQLSASLEGWVMQELKVTSVRPGWIAVMTVFFIHFLSFYFSSTAFTVSVRGRREKWYLRGKIFFKSYLGFRSRCDETG